MIRTILAFCGYVKVPREAIRLSMEIEEGYKRLHNLVPENESAALLYKGSKTMTAFLRSGRLISFDH